MAQLGLLGKKLSHSFSPDWFASRFEEEQRNDLSYELIELDSIEKLLPYIHSQKQLAAFNVTLPYKESILPFLDVKNELVLKTGACNTVLIKRNGDVVSLEGFNTDVYGFSMSVKPFLALHHHRALVLGTGGASQAVNYSLRQLGIDVIQVSRTAGKAHLTYSELNKAVIQSCLLIINCSPAGMYPDSENCPEIPYEFLLKEHLLVDLIYNPQETLFLKKGKEKSASVLNGLSMLHLQAEKSWELFKAHIELINN